MGNLDLTKYDELGNELAESASVFEALANPDAAKIPAKAKIWTKPNASKGKVNGFPYDGHNIPITKPAELVKVSLEPVHRNLRAALTKFYNLCDKIIISYAKNIVEVKEINMLREPGSRYKNYDFDADATEIREHIKSVNEYRVGDGKGGILEPVEETIDNLDSYCSGTDKRMELSNDRMISIFEKILRNKLTLADIKEYEILYKSVYLLLCEAVKKFYINVIEAIGDKADYGLSPDFLVDYFKRKGIADKASTLSIIPMTKNMFGEKLCSEKANGDSDTGKRTVNKITFESKVIGQQSSDNKFKKEMEKFTSK